MVNRAGYNAYDVQWWERTLGKDMIIGKKKEIVETCAMTSGRLTFALEFRS